MEILLTTRRLFLRPLRESDSGILFGYRSRPEVFRYQTWCPADETEIRAFIENQKTLAPGTPGTWFQLAMVLREDGAMIGDAGLHFPEEKSTETEIGITLAPEFQGRGFASEALEEIFRYVFSSLGKERITASVDPRNQPSTRLLERMGMRREGFFHGSMTIRGELVDDVVYALRKREYRNGRPDSGGNEKS